jgi:microcystin degradation protein MlrC
LLRELLTQNVPCLSLVPVVDAAGVNAAHLAGVAATIKLRVGGRDDHVFSQPVDVTGRVAALSEGVTVEIADRGICEIGRTALIECGAIRIALLDNRSFAINHPILYTHLGIDVGQAKLVVVKTASNFQFFSRWRKSLIRVDTPGTTQSDLSAFRWRRIPRPIFPFDEVKDWRPDPAITCAVRHARS